MQANTIRALIARRPSIRARWQALLKVERVNTPLARPELLAYLIDETMDEVFAALSHSPDSRRAALADAMQAERAACHCGRNPLLVFFISGEQALLEELINAQADGPTPEPGGHFHEVAELYLTVRRMARHEVGAFCSLCMHAPGRKKSPPATVG